MIRYVNDRFVDVELVVSEKTGLKIPNSAITKNSFIRFQKSILHREAIHPIPDL